MLDVTEGAIASDDDLLLFELAAWSRSQLDDLLARHALPLPLRPGDAAIGGGSTVLRVTPCVAWVVAEPGNMPSLRPGEDGVVIDLSNSRIRIRLRSRAGKLLSRLVAVEFPDGPPSGSFAATMIRGVPVTVLHAEHGADILVPRSFHASLLAWIEEAARGLADR